jgi:Domain of unknown function (DUF397)
LRGKGLDRREVQEEEALNVDLAGAAWRKSSYSGNNGGDCVEVAGNLHAVVAVRDSKDRQGPVLIFGPAEWRAFAAAVRAGEFDLT